MRNEEMMFSLILEVAKKLDGLKAVALNGSRANQNVPKDAFQDYDIVYFIKDQKMEKLINHQEWLKAFGELLIRQTPATGQLLPCDMNGKFTFLMLFADGNRIDLCLCPLSKINDWVKEDSIGKILYDPHQLLPTDLLTDDQIYWCKEPTETHFQECCNEFWWVSTYVVKGICRKEFLYASDHFYQVCYQELLRLISWQIAEEQHYQVNFGKNYKYLFNYLTQEQQQTLSDLLDFTSLEKLAKNLMQMQQLFHQQAQHYSQEKNFAYQLLEGQNVLNYTKALLTNH
ncbi:aminoglycoside 6-adenylyltransferase [Enterococcus sp. PF1-24]|uniref:aminoglycoside 6-adenylyltransferase n=1 Tax=unclassified Enterococcus TaxID=2608891 RepID=UPI002473D0B8|nr:MULTISPECIES: aminoglycoside 6-adenylyltransferase [unclassified Enterococcus]MDH6364986.1 aminoglycoside 6-adenylyltransferase [Enterococcus sp. PFB1-1]MDH6402087.1 aminoglycoside 6-adenylyltransferase [Enterococcus sp. PF1-24]